MSRQLYDLSWFCKEKTRESGLLQFDGAKGRDRTGDTVIFSHVLYQLSYLGAYLRGDRLGFAAQVWSPC